MIKDWWTLIVLEKRIRNAWWEKWLTRLWIYPIDWDSILSILSKHKGEKFSENITQKYFQWTLELTSSDFMQKTRSCHQRSTSKSSLWNALTSVSLIGLSLTIFNRAFGASMLVSWTAWKSTGWNGSQWTSRLWWMTTTTRMRRTLSRVDGVYSLSCIQVNNIMIFSRWIKCSSPVPQWETGLPVCASRPPHPFCSCRRHISLWPGWRRRALRTWRNR